MKKILLIAISFIVGFVAGINHENILPGWKKYVDVSLNNTAQKSIKYARLESEGGIIYVVENLKSGTSKNIRMFVRGESSYSLLVEFSDGVKLKGGAGYIEPGYSIKEVIADDKIQTEMRSF